MIPEIIQIAASHFRVTPEGIKSHSHKHRYSKAKFAVYKALHMRGNCKTDIGRWLKRDHSTICYGITRAEYWMERDRKFRALVERMAEWEPIPVTLPEKAPEEEEEWV